MAKTILVLNGPNLNMLGKREPEIYGHGTLDDIGDLCRAASDSAGYACDFRQSNHEGELVTWVQEASQNPEIAGVIVNAGAYTHTSVALHDALRLLVCPIYEVHLSDPSKREEFRHISYIEPLAAASICGFGADGYKMAVMRLVEQLKG